MLGLLWIPASLSAQTVTVGQGFSASFTHDGLNTAGYRLYLDNQPILDVPVSVLQSGSATLRVPAVSVRGPHTLIASAYNADGETKTAPLAFDAKLPAPNPPTTFTIVVQVAEDGSVSLKLLPLAQ